MAYRKLLMIIAGISSLIFYSCKDYPTDVGAGLVNTNLVNVKSLNSSTDSLNQSSSYFKRVLPLGNGTRLMLGNYNDVQSSVLLNFYFLYLPDSIAQSFRNDSVKIVSATVTMYPTVTFGDSTANFDFTVHQVNSNWGTTTFDADSLPNLSYNASDMSSNKSITDTMTTFDLDVNVVSSWLTSYVDSNYTDIHGMYLQPTPGSQKIVGFQAYSSQVTDYSNMTVVFQKGNEYTDTLSFMPIQDISVVKGPMPQVKSTEIAVQGGVTVNSKLWFDLSSIPANSVINQATLTLTIDTLDSHYIDSTMSGLTVWNLKDSSSNSIDSTISSSIGLYGDTFQGDIKKLVQNWVDQRNNQGMLLEDINYVAGVSLFAIKGSNYPDASLRPRLKITYTTRN